MPSPPAPGDSSRGSLFVAEEGALLGPTGAQLCVVASTVLLLLYWRYAQGSAPPSPYI